MFFSVNFFLAIIIWLVLYWAIYLWPQQKSRNITQKMFRHPDFYTAILVAGFSIIPFVYINYSYPGFKTDQDQISYGKKKNDILGVIDAYKKILNKNASNTDLHFEYIDYSLSNSIPSDSIVSEYIRKYNNADDSIKDEVFLAFAYCYLKKQEFEVFKVNVESNLDTNQRNINLLKGFYFVNAKDDSTAKLYLYKEIQNKIGNKKAAYELLMHIYKNDPAQISKLAKDDNRGKYIDPIIKKLAFYKNREIGRYFYATLETMYSKLNLMIVVLTLLASILWLLFVFRLDVFEKETFFPVFFVFLSSFLFAYVLIPITDFINVDLTFTLNNDPLNNLFYSIFSIGLLEEIIKILPILFLLKRTKVINEPYDLVFYASVSAIAFATHENLLYFQNGDFSIVSSRAFMSILGHIMDSSIAVYGLILIKYLKNEKSYKNVYLWFAYGVLAHGLFDFFILSGIQYANVFSFFIFLIQIRVWVVIVNNTINCSPYISNHVFFSNGNYRRLLIVGLVAIWMSSYFADGLDKGSLIANLNFLETFSLNAFLLVFLITGFTSFDIIEGYIEKIEVWQFYKPRIVKTQNNIINQKVLLSPTGILSKKSTKASLDKMLPLTGTIIKRIVVDEEKNCALVKLDRPLELFSYQKEYIIVKPRKAFYSLYKSENVISYVMMIRLNVEMREHGCEFDLSEMHFAGFALLNTFTI